MISHLLRCGVMSTQTLTTVSFYPWQTSGLLWLVLQKPHSASSCTLGSYGPEFKSQQHNFFCRCFTNWVPVGKSLNLSEACFHHFQIWIAVLILQRHQSINRERSDIKHLLLPERSCSWPSGVLVPKSTVWVWHILLWPWEHSSPFSYLSVIVIIFISHRLVMRSDWDDTCKALGPVLTWCMERAQCSHVLTLQDGWADGC